jgi:GNAT superfamily N-acetyltransferase
MDPLDRYLAFEERWLARVSTDVVPFAHGAAYLDRDHPQRWDANFLRVGRAPGDVSADELLAEAERILGGAGYPHRAIVISDDEAGTRLAPAIAAAGYTAEPDTTMIFSGRPPDRESDLVAEECRFAQVEELIREGYRREHGDPAIVDSFADLQHRFEQLVGARFFMARVDGVPAGRCKLYLDAGDAQVESVSTLEEFRGRGVARAIVLAATRAALAAGARDVFIVADDSDWPKHLYERLGYDHIGRTWQYVREPPR